MDDIAIDLDLGVKSGRDIDIVDVAKRINQHMLALNLKTKSTKKYRAVRREYTKQLENVPLETLKELAKHLFWEYDLGFLGYDMIYYHGTKL